MTDYYEDRRYDEPRRYRGTRTRPRRRDDSEYVEETTFIEHGRGPPPRDLVAQVRDRDDSPDNIHKELSPPAGRRPRAYNDYGSEGVWRARSTGNRRNDNYEDDLDDDYLPAPTGRGYSSRSSHGGDVYDRESYYSDDYTRESGPQDDRKKSGVEGALEGLGLGGLAGTLLGKSRNRSRSRSQSHDGRYSRNRSRARGDKKQREWAQAAQAALIAGAVEAFRSRNEPGPWTGTKGKRIATAALASGGIDKLVDRDPDRKNKLHLVEAVVGGLAANRLANGPTKSSSRDERGRSRSRSVFSRYRSKSRRNGSRGSGSRGRGLSTSDKIKDAGAGVVLAGVGKQIYDRFRSKSRRRRSLSAESYGDSPNRLRHASNGPYSRSRALTAGDDIDSRSRGRSVAADAPQDNAKSDRKRDSSSDSLSSTDMENRRKKMRGKEFLTAGLATIATIHAAHGVYSSMEASDKRHKLVAGGEMTPEEARKKRSKAWLQDAAAVGIAALGIKGAYSEWKEMNEQRHSVKELEERRRARQKRREKRLKAAAEQGGTGAL